MSRGRRPGGLQRWIDARKRYRLSREQVHIARELDLNPRKRQFLDVLKTPPPVFSDAGLRKAAYAKFTAVPGPS
jgi:hypothetical protein